MMILLTATVPGAAGFSAVSSKADVSKFVKRGLAHLENNSDTLLKKNLDYLREHSSWRTISAIEKNLKTGTPPSLRIENETEFYAGELLLHSRRAPEREAVELLDKWLADDKADMSGMITVLGSGGLFHVKALAGKIKTEGLLFVADLFPENFIELMRNVDLAESSGTENIFFSVSSDQSEIAHDFRVQLSRRGAIDTFFFTHPGTLRVWREPYSNLSKRLVEEYSLEAMNRKTRAFYGPDWHRNTTLNMAYSFTCPSIGVLKDLFKGATAIVVAAGPSLSDAIPYIKKLADKSIIIAPGTALKPLLDAGIVPDFTVAVDSSPNVFKQYAKAGHPDIHLAADTIVMPELFDKFSGRSFLFSSGSVPDVDELLADFEMRPAKIAAGGTVSLSAIEIARLLGCSDIVLSGLDLAVSADGTSHAQGTVYDGRKCDKNELVESEGNSGNKVLTTKQFKNYIDVMSSYFGNPSNTAGINVVNASPDGARIGPLRICAASEIAQSASFRILSGDKKLLIKERYAAAAAKIGEDAHGVEFFAQALKELPELRNLSQKASSAALSTKKKPEALTELEKFEAAIKKNRTALRLVNTALRRALEALFSHGAGTPSEALGKSAELYSEMSDASGFTYDFLVQSARKYDELRKMKKGDI